MKVELITAGFSSGNNKLYSFGLEQATIKYPPKYKAFVTWTTMDGVEMLLPSMVTCFAGSNSWFSPEKQNNAGFNPDGSQQGGSSQAKIRLAQEQPNGEKPRQ